MEKIRIFVGKVMGYDRHGVTLYVPFHDRYQFLMENGAEFFTMVFVRPKANAAVEMWNPWEMERVLIKDDPGCEPSHE